MGFTHNIIYNIYVEQANATVFGAVTNIAANAAVTAIVGDGDGDEDSSDDSGGEN